MNDTLHSVIGEPKEFSEIEQFSTIKMNISIDIEAVWIHVKCTLHLACRKALALQWRDNFRSCL
jgi:hypothetical protein